MRNNGIINIAMATSPSLLDYLKKEDSLMKERDRNFDREVRLMHTIDDAEDYPSVYNIPKDELQKYKDEVIELDNREDEIRDELKKVRARIRRYLVRLFDDI